MRFAATLAANGGNRAESLMTSRGVINPQVKGAENVTEYGGEPRETLEIVKHVEIPKSALKMRTL